MQPSSPNRPEGPGANSAPPKGVYNKSLPTKVHVIPHKMFRVLRKLYWRVKDSKVTVDTPRGWDRNDYTTGMRSDVYVFDNYVYQQWDPETHSWKTTAVEQSDDRFVYSGYHSMQPTTGGGFGNNFLNIFTGDSTSSGYKPSNWGGVYESDPGIQQDLKEAIRLGEEDYRASRPGSTIGVGVSISSGGVGWAVGQNGAAAAENAARVRDQAAAAARENAARSKYHPASAESDDAVDQLTSPSNHTSKVRVYAFQISGETRLYKVNSGVEVSRIWQKWSKLPYDTDALVQFQTTGRISGEVLSAITGSHYEGTYELVEVTPVISHYRTVTYPAEDRQSIWTDITAGEFDVIFKPATE